MGDSATTTSAEVDADTDAVAAANATAALLRQLRVHDAAASLTAHAHPGARFCSNAHCLCAAEVTVGGHVISVGHGRLDDTLDVCKVTERILRTPCRCCARERALARRVAKGEARVCYTCGSTGHLVRQCPQTRCNFCGERGHLAAACSFGGSTAREDQFLRCGPACFVRRFVVPLHRASLDFDPDSSLRDGRIDLAARLVSSALVSSQRLRHNTELCLPFLGMERPSFLCVTGGLARGIHPCEAETAHRLRAAIDYLADGEPAPHAARPRELRGFRLAEGGFEEALEEALTLARAPPRRSRIAAPLLLLLQGAPPLAAVLQRLAEETGAEAAEEEFAGEAASAEGQRGPLRLDDCVIALGDDRGLTSEEVEAAWRIGATAGGGGRVLAASLGGGALLASHCIVLCHHYLDALHDCPLSLWEEPSTEVQRLSKQRQRRRRAGRRGVEAAAVSPGDGEGAAAGSCASS